MRRIGLIFFLLIVTVAGVQGQVRFDEFEGVDWWAHVGGHAYQYVDFIEVDDSGNVYVAGRFDRELYLNGKDGVDLDYFADWLGDEVFFHYFFAKYNSLGELEWVTSLERRNTSYFEISDVSWAQEGHPVALVTFEDTLESMGGERFYPKANSFRNTMGINVLPSGTLEVAFQIWGRASVWGEHITPLSNGNTMVTISTTKYPVVVNGDSIGGITGPQNSYPLHGNFLVLDQNGEVLHFDSVRHISGVGVPGKMKSDSQGNLYMIMYVADGNSSGSVIVKEDTVSGFGHFLVKLDADMNIVYQVGPINYFQGQFDLIPGDDGSLYIGQQGSFVDSISSNLNVFLTKLNADGDTIWSTNTLGSSGFYGGIAQDNKSIFLSGYYGGSIILQGIEFVRSTWGTNGFLSRIDKNTGDLIWLISDTTSYHENAFGRVTATNSGKITISLNFDQNYVSLSDDTVWIYPFTGFNDVALYSFSSPILPDTVKKPSISKWFNVYPNPNNGVFTIGVHENFVSPAAFEIWDMKGRKVMSVDVPEIEKEIQFSNLLLGTGVYMIRLRNSDGMIQQTKKVIILPQ
jgi:hypothetical protein